MKCGVCLCVVMAVLAAGALAQPVVPVEAVDPMEQRAEEAPRRQLRAVLRPDSEPRARLGALLARYIQQVRKGGALYPRKTHPVDSQFPNREGVSLEKGKIQLLFIVVVSILSLAG
uniref:Cholecystokinin n=1 Tax=Rattus norvegicus TaxID=10116 RepID=A0ABK0LUS3_RAT|eukprot:XP_017450966.1 PREDICTED: cholecystokinin isoform X1 [Rattus norvegicus]